MTRVLWKYGSPWVREGVVVAFTENGRLVGAYRRSRRRWRVTYDLFATADREFGTETDVRQHLQAEDGRRFPS